MAIRKRRIGTKPSPLAPMTPDEKETALREWQELEAARKRLESPKQRLAWIIEFMNIDLGRLSPSERDLVGYNLRALIPSGSRWPEWHTSWVFGPMHRNKIGLLQRHIRKALESLFSEPGDWSLRPPKKITVHRVTPLDAKKTEFQNCNYTPEETLAIMYGVRDAVTAASEHLRACKRCHKPFVATRRQEYCATACSQITRNETKKRLREEKPRGKLYSGKEKP